MQLESVLIQNLDLAAHPQLLRTGQSWPKPCVFTEMLRKQEGWTFLGLYGNTHSREQLGSHHGLPAHRAAHLSRLIIHPEYLYCSLAHPLLGRWIAISHLSQKKTIKGNWKRQHYFFYFFFFFALRLAVSQRRMESATSSAEPWVAAEPCSFPGQIQHLVLSAALCKWHGSVIRFVDSTDCSFRQIIWN